jgi:hypothetical protein
LCQVWLKLAQWFWRGRLLNDPNLFFIFLWLSPLWRGPDPLFEQTWIPFIQRKFVQSLIEFGLLVLEKIFFLNFSVFSIFRYYLTL